MVPPEPEPISSPEVAEPETKPEVVPVPATDTVTAVPVPDVEVQAVQEKPAIVEVSAQEHGPVEVPSEPTQGVPSARELVEAWRGTSSASVSLQDWRLLAEALTDLHQTQAMDGPALDEMLAAVFVDGSPRSIVPQIGEATKPLYESETFVPGGVVAEVLRVGIEIPTDGSPNRPTLPLVRLAPKSESK